METKKKIIIQEIRYWQKNQLLPEHYCLFLLNLYQEGEGNSSGNAISQERRSAWKMGFVSLLISIGLIGTFLVAINFQSFSTFLQGSILFLFSFIFYGITIWMKQRKLEIYHLTLGVGSLSLLFSTLWVGSHLDLGALPLFLSLIAVLFFWLFSGFILKTNYIIFISLIGFMAAYGWYMHPWIIQKQSALFQHVIWYPLAAIGIGIGLWLLKREVSAGKIFFFSGITALLISIVHTFFFESMAPSGQFILFAVELVVAAVVLFYTRTQWLK